MDKWIMLIINNLLISGVDYDWFCSGWSKSENFDLKWDLNPRPLDWYSAALPTELFRSWYYYHSLLASVFTQQR